MKRLEKYIAIILSAIVVFTSMGIGVFANVDNGIDNDNNNELLNPLMDEAVPAAEGLSADSDNGVQAQSGEAVVNLGNTYEGSFKASTPDCILTWDEVKGVTEYYVNVTSISDADGNSYPTHTVGSGNETKFEDLVVGAEYSYKITWSGESADAGDSMTDADDGKLDAVTNLKAVRGYKTVKLTWAPVEGATGYKVYGARYTSDNQTMPATPYTYDTNESDTTFILKNLTLNRYYNIWVVPYKDKNDKSTYGEPERIKVAKVHSLYYNVTFKTKRYLKCHCGGHRAKGHTFKKGYKFTAYGFTSGKYKFIYNGHVYYVSALSCKSASANYKVADRYTPEEAEYFMNELRPSTSTGYAVWTSLYTQTVYTFKKVGGVYKLTNWFQCSSGAAKAPSPTGMSKSVHRKIKKRHKRWYWSCFSSLNSFHGVLKGQKTGYPASLGCVRMENNDAKYIYYKIPKRSRVVSY